MNRRGFIGNAIAFLATLFGVGAVKGIGSDTADSDIELFSHTMLEENGYSTRVSHGIIHQPQDISQWKSEVFKNLNTFVATPVGWRWFSSDYKYNPILQCWEFEVIHKEIIHKVA